MKIKLITAAVLVATLFLASKMMSQNQITNAAKVTVETLQTQGAVLGRLSMPFGTVVKVEGNIESLPAVHAKGAEEFEWLRVDSVNGVVKKTPILLAVQWLGLAEKSTLRGRISVIGYETGRFEGIPSDAFSYIPVAGTEGFHFESYFLVIKRLP